MALNLTSLSNSIKSLERSILTYHKLSKDKSITDDDMETIKAGVIQNFEVAYEQCWKFMKRWIEENVSPDLADGVSRKELYRVSAENKLISDIEAWMSFNKSRNITFHTYNSRNSEITFKTSLLFITIAKDFQKRLEERND